MIRLGVKQWDFIPWRWVDSSEIGRAPVAIDIPNYITRRISVIPRKTSENGRIPLNHITVGIGILRAMLRAQILPVFVFDGPPEKFKRTPNSEIALKASLLYNSFKSEGDPYNEKIAEALWKSPALRAYFGAEHLRDLARCVGVPAITAPSEAEMMAAVMCKEGIVCTVVSNDSDTLLFGSPHTTKQLHLSRNLIHRATLNDLLNVIDLELETLRDLAVICGCDFHTAGVKGIGPRRGASLLKRYGSLEVLLKARGFNASSREEFILAREVFDEVNYISVIGINPVFNPPIVPKIIRLLRPVMGSSKAESIAESFIRLWKDYGEVQETLEQWV
jgi:flap endonuclease-1